MMILQRNRKTLITLFKSKVNSNGSLTVNKAREVINEVVISAG